jgi:hypothetical protein
MRLKKTQKTASTEWEWISKRSQAREPLKIAPQIQNETRKKP